MLITGKTMPIAMATETAMVRRKAEALDEISIEMNSTKPCSVEAEGDGPAISLDRRTDVDIRIVMLCLSPVATFMTA